MVEEVKEWWDTFFPAMMLLPGMGDKYIKYMRSLSTAAEASYKTKDEQRKGTGFVTSRNLTLLERVMEVYYPNLCK